MPIFNSILRCIGFALAVLALVASVGLLIGDMGVEVPGISTAAMVSAAPLLLVGASFLAVQPVMRPNAADFFKNLLLAGTFLLWGAVQLMPQNVLSRRLGDLVIALYVLDLAWVTLGTVIRRERD